MTTLREFGLHEICDSFDEFHWEAEEFRDKKRRTKKDLKFKHVQTKLK